MASDDVIPCFASVSGVDPFSLALGIRYLGEVNSVRSDRCHGGFKSVYDAWKICLKNLFFQFYFLNTDILVTVNCTSWIFETCL